MREVGPPLLSLSPLQNDHISPALLTPAQRGTQRRLSPGVACPALPVLMKPWSLGACSGTQLAPEDLCHASSGNKICRKGWGTAGLSTDSDQLKKGEVQGRKGTNKKKREAFHRLLSTSCGSAASGLYLWRPLECGLGAARPGPGHQRGQRD